MAKKRITILGYRRKREGRTDYRKRLSLLKSEKPRLVIRKSLKNITAQIIAYGDKGDKVLVTAHSHELKKAGWDEYMRNTPAAYLVGLLCGKKAKEKGIAQAVLDSGMYVSTKGSLVYAALKGAVDAGMDIPHSKELMPPEDRIKGDHMGEGIAKKFEQAKAKILGGHK